ncbi:hypothetical protein J4U96_26615, partial [Escherichia coli]
MRGSLLFLLCGATLASPAAAQRGPSGRVAVTPYVEVGQIVDADLTGDDVLTFTSLAAGVDAAADTARISA